MKAGGPDQIGPGVDAQEAIAHGAMQAEQGKRGSGGQLGIILDQLPQQGRNQGGRGGPYSDAHSRPDICRAWLPS